MKKLLISGNHLTRKTPTAYADGVYMMAGQNRPSPRTLSQLFMRGQDGMGSVQNRTALLAFFGKRLQSNFIYDKAFSFMYTKFTAPLTDCSDFTMSC